MVLAAEHGRIESCLRLLRAGAIATDEELLRIGRSSKDLEKLCRLKESNPSELEDLDDDSVEEFLKRSRKEGEVEEMEDVGASKLPSSLYEVSYSSVWIRREPHVEAAQVSKRIKGQRVNIEDPVESKMN